MLRANARPAIACNAGLDGGVKRCINEASARAFAAEKSLGLVNVKQYGTLH